MTGHQRILLDFRGGPRDGVQKDLGESTAGLWPAEYVVHRWPSTEGPLTSREAIVGRYIRTDQWTANVEARIYVWRPEPEPTGS